MTFPDGLTTKFYSLDPTGAARTVVDDVSHTVNDVLQTVQQYAQSSMQTATSTISALAQFSAPIHSPAPPAYNPTVNINGTFAVTPPLAQNFGLITTTIPAAPQVGSVPAMGVVQMPEFTSSISSLNIPNAPAPIDLSGMPAHPSISTDVAIPAAPSLNDPSLPVLAQITIPAFTFPTLPTFTALPPEFAGTPVSTVLNWVEPTYMPTVMNDVVAQIKRYFQGGTGIPAAVEQLMFDRAAAREDSLVVRAVADATEVWSARGFPIPPGMLAAQVTLVQQDALVKKQAAHRELTIKIAEWEIENLRFAVQQGIAAENVLVGIFLAVAARSFEVAKYQVEAALTLYRAQIELFNARQNAYSVAAQVYKTELEGALAVLEVYKAEIEGAKALAQLNTQQVELYSAELRGVMTRVEIYKAQMEGAQLQASLIRNQIEIFKTDVEAYATKIGAEKVVFDAYESQVKAEAAKAGIIDAQARAFAAVIEGKKATIEANKVGVDAAIETNRLALTSYQTTIEGIKAQIAAQTENINAAARAYEAGTHMFSAQAEAQSAMSRAEIAGQEATARIGVALYESHIKQYEVDLNATIKQAEIALEAIKGAATASSSLAAASLSAYHVTAGISGTGQVTAQSSSQFGIHESTNATSNRNYSIISTESGGVQ